MKYQVLEKCTHAVLHNIEKTSNVSRYKFTSIAVYQLVSLYSLSVNLS